MTKVGIVGAGPGGLAAGILLADKGVNVTIHERMDRVGGRNSYLEKGGYKFDIGPTFFMMPFILEEIFAATGRTLHDYVELKMMDPYYKLWFADGKTMTPSFHRDKVKESIASINPEDAAGYDRYMEDNEKKMRYTLPVLQRPYNSFTDLLNKDIFRLLKVLNPQRSLWDDLGKYFDDDRVKVGFTFQSKYLGMSPFNCPSMFSILPYTEYKWGVYHVTGGLNQLATAMAELFKELGGEIALESEVDEIKINGQKATGLIIDGKTYKYDEIVLNADFSWAMQNLIPNEKRKKYSDSRLDKKNYSCSTFMLYLGLDESYDHLNHHNVFIAEDYKKNFLEIESDKVLSKDPSFYLQNPTATDDTLAPPGHSAMYLLVPTANLKGKIDWNNQAESFKEQMLDLLEKRAGITDIRNHIKVEKMITPKDWETQMNVGYGATFNLGHNLRQMLIFRPHNDFEEFENIWLVGGGTNPGSGLPTIYESGRITANLLAKKLGLSYSFDHLDTLEQKFSEDAYQHMV